MRAQEEEEGASVGEDTGLIVGRAVMQSASTTSKAGTAGQITDF